MQRTIEHYRLAEPLPAYSCNEWLDSPPGFFAWGKGNVCFGSCAKVKLASSLAGPVSDVKSLLRHDADFLDLPFDPDRLIDNLLFERYPINGSTPWSTSTIAAAYYRFRPILPDALRGSLQRLYLSDWPKIQFPRWPVDLSVESLHENCLALLMQAQRRDTLPFVWFWPNGYDSAAIVTHDVETEAGRDFCFSLMDIDDAFGVKSAFQIVPEERYAVSQDFLSEIRGRGFEINIHDLNHDGRLFASEEQFMRRIKAVNHYGKAFDTRGFRAAVLYRNHRWSHALDFDFDMSVPNVAHLEPQRGGCCTVFPFFAGHLLELPSTTTQDYALFHFLREYSIDLWKTQMTLIRQKHGLISILVHPDYILKARERDVYLQLLEYLARLRDEHNVWMATPAQINEWWRTRNTLRIEGEAGQWRIEGRGKERARLAYAHLDGDRIRCELATPIPDSSAARLETETTRQ